MIRTKRRYRCDISHANRTTEPACATVVTNTCSRSNNFLRYLGSALCKSKRTETDCFRKEHVDFIPQQSPASGHRSGAERHLATGTAGEPPFESTIRPWWQIYSAGARELEHIFGLTSGFLASRKLQNVLPTKQHLFCCSSARRSQRQIEYREHTHTRPGQLVNPQNAHGRAFYLPRRARVKKSARREPP